MESIENRCLKLGKALLMMVVKMILHRTSRLQTCGVWCHICHSSMVSDTILVTELIQRKFSWYKWMHALIGTSSIVNRSAIAHSQTSISLNVLTQDGNIVSLFSSSYFPFLIFEFARVPIIHLTGIWTFLARMATCHLLVHLQARLDLSMMTMLRQRCPNPASLLPLL